MNRKKSRVVTRQEMVLEIYDREAMGEVTDARDHGSSSPGSIEAVRRGGRLTPAEIARVLLDEKLPVRLDRGLPDGRSARRLRGAASPGWPLRRALGTGRGGAPDHRRAATDEFLARWRPDRCSLRPSDGDAGTHRTRVALAASPRSDGSRAG
jgi:hypothetical protein